MSLKIIKAGILDTIQDMGRYGNQHLGINPAGAMDKYAMQVTNILLGNKLNEAVIEMHFPSSVSIQQNDFAILPWQADERWGDDQKEIFVLPGNEWERLTIESKENFLMTSFVITNQSDRMGYRLNNIPLPVMSNEEVISSGVNFGTVQLLPNGKLIVLMADHQTTGGYPRVAHVISAHHSRLAQMKPGNKIHFRFTDQQT